jgi:Flp pilus assembly pilin Flp
MRFTAKCSERAARLASDESGQGTTEYILLLVTITGVFIVVAKKLIYPMFERLRTIFVKRLESDFFAGDLHRFRISK